MLIGIYGDRQSGRTTLAMFLQALSLRRNRPLEHVNTTSRGDGFEEGWKIVRFRAVIEDMACAILGCTPKQITSDSFLDSVLDEQWWYYFNIPELKSYIAHQRRYQSLNANLQKEWDDTLVRPTPRKILGILTEKFSKNLIHPDVWINMTLNSYTPRTNCFGSWCEKVNSDPGVLHCGNINDCCLAKYPVWIFEDLTDINQIRVIKNKGGILIKISRSHEKTYPEIWKGFISQNRYLFWNDYLNSINRQDLLPDTSLNGFDHWDLIVNNSLSRPRLLEQAKIIYKLVVEKQKAVL